MNTFSGVGHWFVLKYRLAAKRRGYFAVATQLRKQGVPIEVALLVLLGRLS